MVRLMVQVLGNMEIIKASDARANLFNLVEQVNKDHLPRCIISLKGEAILISKADWDSIQETLYLQSIPNLINDIRESEHEDDWHSEQEFMRALDGVAD